MHLPGALFTPNPKKPKKSSRENSYSGKIEFSRSNLKKILIISQEKVFLTFQTTENPKKFIIFSQKKTVLIFREMEVFYILGNGNPEKIIYILRKVCSEPYYNGILLYFEKAIFRTLAQRNFLIFRERHIQNP